MKYITGESNYFADTLLRLKRIDNDNPYEFNDKIPSSNLFYTFNFPRILSKNKDFPLDLNYMRFKQIRDNKLSSIVNNIYKFPEYSYLLINDFNYNNILWYKNKYIILQSL